MGRAKNRSLHDRHVHRKERKVQVNKHENELLIRITA